MPSTPALGTPTVPSNAPSPPLSYIPTSPSFGVDTLSPLTSVTAPVTTSAFSNQSQQPSSASRTPMTTTTVADTTSQSPLVTSSAVPSTSAGVSSISSLRSTITTTPSNTNQSTTTTSAQSTTPSTTITPTTTQSSTSVSLTTSLLSTVASSTPISTAHSTSNAPSTVASSSVHSDSSSQSSSPARSDTPLTTVLEGTTIFITSTNSQGQVVTSVPPVVTEVITTTGSGGIITTITQAVINPTLAPNNSTTEGSSFFANTGAVVGVFVVVGLASASIMMWILFAIRRRLRMRGIEEDNAVEAAVAAAGLNRAPLDDDDDDDGPMSPNARHQFLSEMGQRSSLLGLGGSSSLPTSARLSEVLGDPARDSVNSRSGSPVEHPASSHPKGYVLARTTSPSPRPEQCTDDPGSSRDRKSSYGHTPTYSAGSFEPLLANYAQHTSDQDASALTMEPPRSRSSQRLGTGLARAGYSSDGSPEDESRISMKKKNSSDSSVLNEEGDTRCALTVRNVPDGQSQHSL